ncbi:MAG: hypothetical protein ABIY48_10065 [Acidimicrobiales bacterium]
MSRRACPLVLRPLATGLALLMASGLLLVTHPEPAGAEVTHLHGFWATVDGFTSWYGSYGMGPLGTAWCIDHGSRSPDPVYGYVPADLSSVPADTQAAVAWAVAAHGQGTDPVAHAGLMLAVHDLMGALYPSGRLDVDNLRVSRLAGFGGVGAQVLTAARAAKADGLDHAHLRGPLHLVVVIGAIDGSGIAPVTVTVADALGQGVAGVVVRVAGSSPGLSAATAVTAVTAMNGSATVSLQTGSVPVDVQASATVPHLPLDAWQPTSTRAQRVARPSLDELTASTELAPPTTTTTMPPTTTTTPETTTTAPTTTTTPETTTTTAAPASTSTSTTVAALAVTTTVTDAPPTTTAPTGLAPAPSVLAAPGITAPLALPRTGVDALTFGLFGTGLVLVGHSLLGLRVGPTGAQPRAPRSRRPAMRSSS